MNEAPVLLDGRSLTLADVEAVAYEGATVGLAPDAEAEVGRSRRLVERLLEDGTRIYGVTTGFGRLSETLIAPDEQRALQRNLVRSHSAGVGPPLADEEVRAILLLRANTLARGQSGCRPAVVKGLIDFLNHRVHPVVPELGSVGASGDLAPLAHVALALMGEGSVRRDGRTSDTANVLAEVGLQPLDLAEKEGVALINGTQATTGIGGLALARLRRATETADVAGALTLEGLMGTPDAFRAEIHEARPHPGQLASAERLWSLLQGSEIRESHREDDPRVQDSYSLRCMPQVHGAAREAVAYAEGIIVREANSTTDNPLVLPDHDLVISGGNFHAQIVAQCLDLLAIAGADLAAISERRIERLLNPDFSGLPAFLTRKPGLSSGFMIGQVTAADALAEMRVLATPASIDSVPTSAGQEDHVSMGLATARKIKRSVALLEIVLAIELMCAAQALEFRRPLRSSPGVERAFDVVRSLVPPLEDDRVLSHDIEALAGAVSEGLFSSLEEV